MGLRQNSYRFCFFDDLEPHAAAVLVLHFASDSAACAEADGLLGASDLARIEVWQGTRKLCQHRRNAVAAAPVVCGLKGI